MLSLNSSSNVDHLGTNIPVGDRDFRPRRSPSGRLHLSHRAAEIYPDEITDAGLLELLRTKIEKYNVLDVIGRGGMGTVYKAIDPTMGRLVAIKTVTGVFSDDPLLLKRFYREAHSTGKVQHPNIVTVYDLGDQEGVPYLVMEYLEGES